MGVWGRDSHWGRATPSPQGRTEQCQDHRRAWRRNRERGQASGARQREMDGELAALARPQLAITHQWLCEKCAEPLSQRIQVIIEVVRWSLAPPRCQETLPSWGYSRMPGDHPHLLLQVFPHGKVYMTENLPSSISSVCTVFSVHFSGIT